LGNICIYSCIAFDKVYPYNYINEQGILWPKRRKKIFFHYETFTCQWQEKLNFFASSDFFVTQYEKMASRIKSQIKGRGCGNKKLNLF